MKEDAASLDNLRDISVPAPVPWWPPAPGWWVVSVVVVVAVLAVAFLAWRRWRSNAYRRAALRALASASNVGEIGEILKRTALCAYPRNRVASLSGSAWCRWLGETSGREVSASVAGWLTDGIFRDANSKDTGELAKFAEDWIQHHRLPS